MGSLGVANKKVNLDPKLRKQTASRKLEPKLGKKKLGVVRKKKLEAVSKKADKTESQRQETLRRKQNLDETRAGAKLWEWERLKSELGKAELAKAVAELRKAELAKALADAKYEFSKALSENSSALADAKTALTKALFAAADERQQAEEVHMQERHMQEEQLKELRRQLKEAHQQLADEQAKNSNWQQPLMRQARLCSY